MNTAVVERASAIAKFALVPGLSMVTTILILPLVSAQFGTDGIVSLNLGQSVGALASVAVGMGWPVVGANAVAGATREMREEVCLDSLLSRGLVFAVLVVPTMAVAWLVSPVHSLAAMLFALGTVLNGFTFAWYYAGVNRPRLLVRNEALMRLAGNALAIPLLWVTHSLYAYAGLLVVVGVGMLSMNANQVLSRTTVGHASWPRAIEQTKLQMPLTVAKIVTAAGYYMTSPVVSAVSLPILGAYSASDKMQKSLGNAAEAIPSGLASWVSAPAEGTSQRAHRIRQAITFCMAMSVCIMLGWMALGQFITGLLFHGTVRLGFAAQTMNGLAIAVSFAASSLAQLAMVPSQNVGIVARLSPAAAIVGLVFTAWGARHGITWALLGAASSNILSTIVYLCVAQAWLKKARQPRRAIPEK